MAVDAWNIRGVNPVGLNAARNGTRLTWGDARDCSPAEYALTEKVARRRNDDRGSFWEASEEEVDRIAAIVIPAGARNVEGPMFCPEYSPTYYGLFFEDPCGNRLEVCCRLAKP